ncbi:MAG: NAD(P)-dependent oxidoreductase [Tannerella sp.]|nr:NAD(P)-dependent oxidoreductase [Tannerella sp.]
MAERKRILVTGASGFIGGFLVEEALRRNYDVWAGVRSGSSLARLRDERIRLIDLAYDDREALTKQLRKITADFGAWHYVIHNAGITKTVNTDDFYKVNVRNTRNLTEALQEAGCAPEKFLLMSSLSSFGPINERSFKPISPDDEQRPDSAYGKSKLEAETIVKSQTSFPYVILCPTGVYGPGDKDYLLEIRSIKSGFDVKAGMKPQKITFIYVKDLAVAAFLALENKNICNRTFLVSDADTYTDREFADLVKKILEKRFVLSVRIPLWMCYLACFFSGLTAKITGKTPTLNTDKYKTLKQRNWTCDTAKTRMELDFVPNFSLEEGLKETIAHDKKTDF